MKGETGVQILLQLWHPGVEILWKCFSIEILWQLYGLLIPIEENIMSITAPLAISNTAVSPGAAKQTYFHYLQKVCNSKLPQFLPPNQ